MKKHAALLAFALSTSLCSLAQYDRNAALTDATPQKQAALPRACMNVAVDPAHDAPLTCNGQCTWYPSTKPSGPSVLYQVYDIRGQWALMNEVEMSDKKAWVYVPAMGGCWVVPEPTTQNLQR